MENTYLLMGLLSVCMLVFLWNKQHERHAEIDRTTVDLIELQNKIISKLTDQMMSCQGKIRDLEDTIKNKLHG